MTQATEDVTAGPHLPYSDGIAAARTADGGQLHLSLAYQQGGMVMWATAGEPNLALYAASDPTVVRGYQEDQVLDVVRSDPLGVNSVSEISLNVQGGLADVFDGTEHIVAVVIQRPHMRQVYVP
jgi:hypothetical protein